MSDLPRPEVNVIRPLVRARRRASRVLWIEQLWPAILPGLAVVLGLVVLSLLTVPQRLPVWLHAMALLAAVAWLARQLRRQIRALRPPSARVLDQRIERASRLPHRPLSTLSDRPALDMSADDPASLIWHAHLQRTEAGLDRLGAGTPRLPLRAHDPFHLAPALLVALVLALVVAGRDAPIRIASGFWPGLDVPLGPKPSLQAWITPPDFTGSAPIFLTDPHGRYTVPAGARLTVSLTGTNVLPELTIKSPGRTRFERLSSGSWTLERVLAGDTPVTVRSAGYRLADWRIVVQQVSAPVVAWNGTPGPATDIPWHTRLPWSVSHRYGVRTLTAELRLAGKGGSDRVLRVQIPLSGNPTQAHGLGLPDLSADPWAGSAVTAKLIATDIIGQTGSSAEARFTLPARMFRNPLARAVLDVRRRLALGQEPPAEAADDLQALGDTPGAFTQDSSLFLNLSTDASLLRLPGSGDRSGEASDRLWELALALEDGLHNDRAGARAALDVRAAQDRLSAQLEHMRQLGEKGQSPSEQTELQARIAALSQAIARRMQALAAQAAREHTTLPPMPDQARLGGQDLSRMLKKMQDEAAAGHTEEAMRQLSQMQAMLEHMRAATPQDLETARRQAAGRQQAQDQMAAVQDLVQRQSALLDHAQARQAALDRTRKAAEDAVPGGAQAGTTDQGEDAAPGSEAAGSEADAGHAMDPATRALMQQLGLPMDGPGTGSAASGQPAASPPASNPAEMAAQQAARQADRHAQHVLRRALDELATEFGALTGKKADSLAAASKAMNQAHMALGNGKDGPATQAQMQALAALQQGAQQMRSAMSASGSASNGVALLPGTGGNGAGSEPDEDGAGSQEQDGEHDPLGRHLASGHAGMDDGSETHIPDQEAPARSREIEQELRRRDSDRTRPQPELDYLDRLLKPF